MGISKKIEASLVRSSWIRKMFEEGTRLKAIHGNDKVFDFTLGNPNQAPPEAFSKALISTVQNIEAGGHGYMPNPGYPFVREAVAAYISSERHIEITAEEIIITCGAAGAINVVLKTILDPGEEVLVPSPYFMEYGFYVDNHGGVLKTVRTRPDFTLDLDAIAEAVTEKTRAVLINFPNNPTGQVYSEESLAALGRILTQKSNAFGSPIYLISDEPYRKLIYDGVQAADVLAAYGESIIVTSFSKDISVPGERIGYIAISPRAGAKKELADGMTFSNRTLGFVNAPALMQRVVAKIIGAVTDIGAYARKRDMLCRGLAGAGYDFVTPSGAFYLFPKAPVADDVAFVNALQEELILTVPGTGFGAPGYFRIAFCVEEEIIANAIPGFKRVMDKFK